MAGASSAKSRNIDMINGPLWNKILIYFIPVLGASVMTRLIHAIDIAVVSRFAGTMELAAIGATSSISGLFTSLVSGFGVGASVVVGQLVGARKDKTAKKAMHNGVLIGIAGGTFITIVGLIFLYPILKATGTPEEVIDKAALYLGIIFLTKPFTLTFHISDAISRSKGDSKTPLICVVVGNTINLVFDLLFVAVFQWGVFGAAFATFIAMVAQCFIILRGLCTDEEKYRLSVRGILKPDKYIISRIIKFGIPASIQGMLTPLGNTVILSAYNSLGTAVVAANPLGSTIEGLTFCVTGAFTATASAFVSQNYGAGKLDRCKKTLWITITLSTIFTYLFDIIILLFKNQTIGIFTNDPKLIDLVHERIFYITCGHFFLIVVDQLTSGLRGFGKTLYPSIISICGICGIRILWIFTIFPIFKTYKSIVQVYPVSFIITAVVMFTAYITVYKKVKKQFAERKMQIERN